MYSFGGTVHYGNEPADQSCPTRDCHRLNCDYCLGGVMGSVFMCIFNVD